MKDKYTVKELIEIKSRFDQQFPELDLVSMIRPKKNPEFEVYMKQFSRAELFPKEIHENIILERFLKIAPFVTDFEIWVFNRKDFILQYNAIFIGAPLHIYIKQNNINFEFDIDSQKQ